MGDNQMERAQPLAGKVALVTGASRGIGLAIAHQLGEMGARLSLCARKPEPLAAAAAGLQKSGIEAFSMMADVTRAADVTRLVDETRKALGPVDILVNNAGLGQFGPFHELSESDWDITLDTNLKGVFLMSRAVAPEMIQRRTGQIINISSLSGKNTYKGGGIYCASKWGLMGLTGCMAEELREFGIRVAAICPGSVATEFSLHVGKDTTKMLQATDVAHAVASLVTQGPTSFLSEVLLRPLQKP
jgi:3-oxoacyl-[acyl-carrier protein] reductase